MSRGPGRAQRFVLDRLAEQHTQEPALWVRADAIAYAFAGGAPTPAELESVRRAVRTLGRRNLVETAADGWPTAPHPAFADGKPPATGWRHYLTARLPLSPAERSADEQQKRERLAELEAMERSIPRRPRWDPAIGPKNERQARELGRLRNHPGAIAMVWSTIVERHEPRQITARIVRSYVELYLQRVVPRAHGR